jgi:hypothetical protein
MVAILALIKSLIPFGIAFLFLWGIGRICCTNSAANQKLQSEDTLETDEDEQGKQQQLKAELLKKHANNKRKEMFAGKQKIFAGKQQFTNGKRDLFSSQEDYSFLDKTNMFSDKQSFIEKSVHRPSRLRLDTILSSSRGKRRRLTSLQQAYLFKEILDPPRAMKPYRSKYPR